MKTRNLISGSWIVGVTVAVCLVVADRSPAQPVKPPKSIEVKMPSKTPSASIAIKSVPAGKSTVAAKKLAVTTASSVPARPPVVAPAKVPKATTIPVVALKDSSPAGKSTGGTVQKTAKDQNSGKGSKGSASDRESGSGNQASQKANNPGFRLLPAKGTSSQATTDNKPAAKEDDIFDVRKRLQQAEQGDTDDSVMNPYIHNGVLDRERLHKDEKLNSEFEFGQVGVGDEAKKAGAGKSPDSTVRGRIEDSLKVRAAGGLAGLEPDDPKLKEISEGVLSGDIRGLDVRKAIRDAANLGIDEQFGAAPTVNVPGLVTEADKRLKAGDLAGFHNLMDHAIDALANKGVNSPGFRADVISGFLAGTRSQSDFDRVAGQRPQDSSATAGTGGLGLGSGYLTAGNGDGSDTRSDGSRSGNSGSGTDSSGSDSSGSDFGSTDTGNGSSSGGSNSDGSNSGGSNSNISGTGTSSSPSGSGSGTTDSGNGSGSSNSGSGSSGSGTGTGAGGTESSGSVTSPEGEIVVASSGNDSAYEHRQSEDGNTAADINYNSDGTYTGTTTTKNADGTIATTHISGTWSEGDDGQRHLNTVNTTETPRDPEDGRRSPPTNAEKRKMISGGVHFVGGSRKGAGPENPSGGGDNNIWTGGSGPVVNKKGQLLGGDTREPVTKAKASLTAGKPLTSKPGAQPESPLGGNDDGWTGGSGEVPQGPSAAR